MYRRLIMLVGLLSVLVVGAAQATPSYDPFGPQFNVPVSTILSGGWTQCYAATFDVFIGYSGENVLNQCHGDKLMMAGRATGSGLILLLAEADFADVTFNTGTGTSNTHTANGTNWYYAPDWSWGFVSAPQAVSLSQCDVLPGADRLCLHTVNDAGGYRIGDLTGLNSSPNYEKLFFVANSSPVPEPSATLLLAMSLVGLLVGYSWRKQLQGS